jgi:Fungal specific transcription factor domain
MEGNNKRRVPLEKRKRTEASCDKCKTRKQKCDRTPGQLQCRYCELHGITCSTTQPHKQRIYWSDETIRGRLALLESLVKGLLPEADLSSNDEMQQLGKSLGIPLPIGDDIVGDSDNINVGHEDEHATPLLPDQQGQIQYIGPASSFSFHHKLRSLMGGYANQEFAMFGPNAAEQYTGSEAPVSPEVSSRRGRVAFESISSSCSSPSDAVREIDGPILDSLIEAFFDVIHSDFPVLHEATFRETYEIWSASGSVADPSWLCVLLCVLILSCRVAPITIPAEAEQRWWRHVQLLLPTVFFSTNIFAVQALLLAALHLHNTTHRDACWNLTGTAVRVAFAIGLHRDDIKHVQGPLGRELRKQLWWTLYAFEQMQVSSYDRPSAIDHAISSTSCPNERIVGVAGHCPQDLMKWSHKLVLLLGLTCKALNHAGARSSAAAEDAYSRPLSPAAGILRDLTRWKEALPAHLRLEASDSLPPSSQRPILLLHAQYYYLLVLITRSALLRRATILSRNSGEAGALPQILLTVSKTCVDSGRSLGRIMRKMANAKKFNAFTWWDIFYTVTSALVLALDIICCVKQPTPSSTEETKKLLRELADLASEQLRDSRVPGSMRKWASVVIEVCSIVDQFTASTPCADQNAPTLPAPQDSNIQTAREDEEAAATSGSYAVSTNMHRNGLSTAVSSKHAAQIVEGFQPHKVQNSFVEDDQLQDWWWNDVGAILQGNSFHSSDVQRAGSQ